MWIFLEWCFGIILFFLGIGELNDNTFYDEHYSLYDSELGIFYIVCSIIVFIFAYGHTQMFEDYNYYEGRTYTNTLNSVSVNSNNRPFIPIKPIIFAKTQTEIINDISANYPKTNTVIKHFTEHKIKKGKFFFLNQKSEIVTSVINIPKKNDKEGDLISFNQEEEKDIFNALSFALQKYICYEDIQIIKSNLIHAEYDESNNINVFYNHSLDVNIYGNLNRYCITDEMKKHLGYCENIYFIEVKDKFEDFYIEWKATT